MPDHFINLIMRLYTNAKLMFTVGDIEAEVQNSIGVRQGSNEGPSLFLFILSFQAVFETMEWSVPKPQFLTQEHGVVTGERWQRVRGLPQSAQPDHEHTQARGDVIAFKMWAALFANDCELPFETREDLVTGAEYIFQHLKRFGLHMHVGRGDVASKTEAMYLSACGTKYEVGLRYRRRWLHQLHSKLQIPGVHHSLHHQVRHRRTRSHHCSGQGLRRAERLRVQEQQGRQHHERARVQRARAQHLALRL
jgi:hypothetical protein